MFKSIGWLIFVYFFAKEFVPIFATIISEIIYRVFFRIHSPSFISLEERSLELDKEKENRKEQKEQEKKAGSKGPIGFSSNRIES